jgi:cell division protein FtsW (lipid II flippase)
MVIPIFFVLAREIGLILLVVLAAMTFVVVATILTARDER